jgi:succinoglycan biosynthesis protein ExoA
LEIKEKSVLIVVPTLNEQANIGACLRELHAQAPKANIVVVDGRSTDETLQIVRELMHEIKTLTFIENPNRTQSCGINLAVSCCAKSVHKILVRCDAHAIYPPFFIEQVLADFNHRDVASVVVPMDAVGLNGFSKAAAWIVDSVLGNGGAKHRGGHFSGYVDHGHHAGMRLDWFKLLGGYDDSFTHNEDAEYDYRLMAVGGKIWMNDKARISYHMRNSFSAILQQYFNYGRGRSRTCAKHRLRPKLRQSLPTLNLICLTVFSIGALWWPLMALVPGLYALSLFGISLTAFVKLRQVSGLWAGPALAVMHNAWAIGFLQFRMRDAIRG